MAESIHDQIIDAIVSSLRAITGDGGTTYWFSPVAVVPVDFFLPSLLDATLSKEQPIYAVRPGVEEHVEGETGDSVGRVAATMEVFIVCLLSFPGPVEADNPFAPPALSRRRAVNRMVRDVLRKLLVDVRLISAGGAVNNVFDSPVLVDRDRAIDNWAMAEINFRVSYTYDGGTP